MSSINGLLNSGAVSTSGNSVANKALSNISERLSEIEEDTTHSDEYKEKQVNKLNSQVVTIKNANANIAYANNLINGMLGKTDVNDFSAFFGNNLTAVKALMQANTTTQNEARTLAAEIRLDKIRGVDTSDKEARLSNMTENSAIMNKSLNTRIDDLLSNDKTDKDTRSVIDKIKDDLKANQGKLDKEFGRTKDDKEEDGVTTKRELSEDSITNSSGAVIDKIKKTSSENKTNEDFSAQA